MTPALIAIVAVLVIVVFVLSASIRVAREYERGVIFRLGRLHSPPKGPGLFFLIPVIDKMVRVDLRTVTLNIPPQEVITKDNVPVRVNAVAYFRIIDPEKAIVQVENFMVATSQISQTTLRSVLGQHVLDELLSERDKINAILQEIIDEATSPWGIKVSIVEVKDVEIPSGMQRAMARQAEAARPTRPAGGCASSRTSSPPSGRGRTRATATACSRARPPSAARRWSCTPLATPARSPTSRAASWSTSPRHGRHERPQRGRRASPTCTPSSTRDGRPAPASRTATPSSSGSPASRRS